MLDSHHRFAKDWDETIIRLLENCDSKKPILSSYPPSFNPATYEEGKEIVEDPWQMHADKFHNDGILTFTPSVMPNWKSLTKPVPARFMSAGMVFTYGEFIKEVPYDPHLYFTGEEINATVRAWTHGWDIFHPHCCFIWHEYTRNGSPKHWDDHTSKSAIIPWHDRDRACRQRVVKMLREEIDLGEYGLGKTRTIKQYENWAGVDFKKMIIHPDALRCSPPGNITGDEWKALMEKEHVINVRWKPEDIEITDDCTFWFFGIEDKDGHLCIRKDLTPIENPGILKKSVCEYTIKFKTCYKPHVWIIWPHSKSQGWLKKYTYTL